MLDELEGQVSYDWVGGDAIYGNSPPLRDHLIEHRKAFVLDVGQELKVYLTHPHPLLPVAALGKGRKPTQLVSEQTPMALKELSKMLPEEQWHTLTYRQGSKGALRREAILLKVWLWKAQEQKTPQELYLLISRETDGSEVKFSLCYQPDAIPDLATCLYRQMQRYWVERAFQEVKQQLGMHRSGAPSIPSPLLDGLVSPHRLNDDGPAFYPTNSGGTPRRPPLTLLSRH